MRIDSSPAWAEPRRVGLFSVMAAGVLLLAGSGRSPGNPGNAAVAHLGTTTTTKVSNSQSDGTQADTSSGAGLGPGPGGVPAGRMAMTEPSGAGGRAVSTSRTILSSILRKPPRRTVFSPGRVRVFPNSLPSEEQGQCSHDTFSPH